MVATEENLKINKMHILVLQQHSPYYPLLPASLKERQTSPKTIGIMYSSH